MLAPEQIVNDISNELKMYKEMAKVQAKVPPQYARNIRNDMYLTSEAFRLLEKQNPTGMSKDDWATIDNYKKHIDIATKFIPGWVMVTHGRRGLARLIEGSISERVLRRAACPVLAIRRD
jgi:inorganic phosphate transporter, PiT family